MAAPNLARQLPELPDDATTDREFVFSEEDFRELSKIARTHTGIVLSDAKRNLVYGRLSRRLRKLGMDSFAKYRAYLAENAAEIEPFINAISTNLTKFFRESHHFDHFRTEIVEPFARDGGKGRLRIWSAGCSTGEEPYTLAMVLRHGLRAAPNANAKILATDIDTDVIARCVQGEYPTDGIVEIPDEYRRAFGLEDKGKTMTMPDSLRQMISFGRLNLIEEKWPMKGPFDAIFCRNVMIYFDGPTKSALVRRFVSMLRPGGFLYIGHSESLLGSYPGLRLMGRTVYRRDS